MKKVLVFIVCLLILASIVGVVMAADPDTATTSATVTVNSFLSVTVDDIPIIFGSLNPGDEDKKPTDDPLVATIGAETNVGSIYVKTKADDTDFVCTGGGCSVGTDKFAISYLEWDVDDSFPGNVYTTSDATVCSGKGADDTCSIYHELEIPDATPAGSYDVGIIITATTTA